MLKPRDWIFAIFLALLALVCFCYKPVRTAVNSARDSVKSVIGQSLYEIKRLDVLGGHTYDVTLVNGERYLVSLNEIVSVPEAKEQLLRRLNEHRQAGGKLYMAKSDQRNDDRSLFAEIYFDKTKTKSVKDWLVTNHLVYN